MPKQQAGLVSGCGLIFFMILAVQPSVIIFINWLIYKITDIGILSTGFNLKDIAKLIGVIIVYRFFIAVYNLMMAMSASMTLVPATILTIILLVAKPFMAIGVLGSALTLFNIQYLNNFVVILVAVIIWLTSSHSSNKED